MTCNNVIMIVSIGFKIRFLKTPLTNIQKPARVGAGGLLPSSRFYLVMVPLFHSLPANQHF